MLYVKGELEKMGLSIGSPLTSMQMIRDRIDAAANPKDTAIEIIERLTNEKPSIDNPIDAKLVAMDVVYTAVKNEHKVTDTTLVQCIEHIKKLRADPTRAWMFAVEVKKEEQEGVVLVEGTETKVVLKDNGKIKKGGKGALAEELYKKRVLTATAPMKIQDVVEMFVKEVGFTKAGAQTYVYDFTKKFGEPKGGLIRGKKGKQKKAGE